jgi:hypothetical protein
MQNKYGLRRRSANSKSEASRPRARRATEESQRQFKERKTSGAGSNFASKDTKSRPRKEELPADNVSLHLSARMLELAQELSSEANMPLRMYLTEALKYMLLAHGKRLGKHDKYVTEFVSQNKLKTSTWSPEKVEKSLLNHELESEQKKRYPDKRT